MVERTVVERTVVERTVVETTSGGKHTSRNFKKGGINYFPLRRKKNGNIFPVMIFFSKK